MTTQRGSAAESGDVDLGVAGFLVVLQAIQRFADPAMPTEPPFLREHIATPRPRARADALQIQRPMRLLRIIVLQRILERAEKLQRVRVEVLVFVPVREC